MLKFLAVSYLVKLGDCQINWRYAQIIFMAGFGSQGVLNEDPTVWLDGVRSTLIKSSCLIT